MYKLGLLLLSADQLRQISRDFIYSFDLEAENPNPIAYYINNPLSSELYLKYILETEGKTETGHNLFDLYKELSHDSKYFIKSKINSILHSQKDFIYMQKGFEKTLKEHSKMFFEWRYIHQFLDTLSSEDINLGFMSNFNLVLQRRSYILRDQNQDQS